MRGAFAELELDFYAKEFGSHQINQSYNRIQNNHGNRQSEILVAFESPSEITACSTYRRARTFSVS